MRHTDKNTIKEMGLVAKVQCQSMACGSCPLGETSACRSEAQGVRFTERELIDHLSEVPVNKVSGCPSDVTVCHERQPSGWAALGFPFFQEQTENHPKRASFSIVCGITLHLPGSYKMSCVGVMVNFPWGNPGPQGLVNAFFCGRRDLGSPAVVAEPSLAGKWDRAAAS